MIIGLSDDELTTPIATNGPQERNAGIRALNPLSIIEKKRWWIYNSAGEKVRSPLHNDDSREGGIALESSWNKQVVSVITENTRPNHGIAPSILLLTSLFSPFNGSRGVAKDFLLAEYDNTRIFYTGDWLKPVHINLLAALFNVYVMEIPEKRNSDGSVNITIDDLIFMLYRTERSRDDKQGGRSSHYVKEMSRLLKDLKNGSFTITEGGDDSATVGEGRGFICNFLNRFSWGSEKEGCFTFGIDHRITNLYSLNNHAFIFIPERAAYEDQRQIDEVAMDMQHLFRAGAEKVDGNTQFSATLDFMMARPVAFSFSLAQHVDRLIRAATSLNPDFISCCKISGTSWSDTITLIKSDKKSVVNDPANLIGLSFESAKAIVTSGSGARVDKTVNSRRKLAAKKDALSRFGVAPWDVKKRIVRAVSAPAEGNDVASASPAPTAAAAVLPLVTPIAKTERSEVVTPTSKKRKSTDKIHTQGLRGKLSDESDVPVYYIMLRDFTALHESFSKLADSDGGFPIYESWIREIEACPAILQTRAIQGSDNPSLIIRALIEKACLWSYRKVAQRKSIAELSIFLDRWIRKDLDELTTGRDDRPGRLSAVEKEANIQAGLDLFLSKRGEEKSINGGVESKSSGFVFEAESSPL